MKSIDATLAAMALLSSACGGATTPAAPSGPMTVTFSGSARIAENGGCSSLAPVHAFSTSPGTLTVTLTQASAPRLMVQVCATGELDHTRCTVPPFARLSVGESLTAAVQGGRSQTIVLYPEGCGGSGAAPGTPVSYTVLVTFPG